ncbi:MAG: site-specific DNA-methyltransferase [Eubacteriales bacterium]|nr:site-specific DNA-methyltransferase [Eubacteriales bacterium]
MANFYDILVEVLKVDKRFFTEDGALLRNKVYESALNMEAGLIELLLSNAETKKRFFVDVNGTFVFDKVAFGWVVNNRQFLPDSYTRFKNRIGLTDGSGELLSASNDVVLSFPYKDCVLEGGQTREEQMHDEVFYNETLAPDEVDRLLYPKVFASARRYTYSGGVDLTGNPNGAVECVLETNATQFLDEDNLIIKGNNLLALSSLLSRYEGKVKCIYIDVPYNTGSDSFRYNDKFNRSTWLVFIKNRLELARKLLHPDGVILIQISFHQYAYLRVLADEIFTEQCHLFDMNTLVRHPDRSLTGDKEFNDVIEYTLIYSKSASYKMPKIAIEKVDDDYQYDFFLPAKPDDKLTLGGKNVSVYFPQNVTIKRSEGHVGGLKSMSVRGSIREKNSSGRFYVAFIEDKIGKYPEGTLFAVPDMGDDGRNFRLFELPKNGNKNGFYYPGKPQSSDVTYKPYPNFVDFVQQYNSVNDEGGYSFRNGKKPEEYVQFYLDIFTHPKDIVLDFCLGSGTTAAVAHKTGRRYIGVEQMDYVDSIAVQRLKSVISGETTGISVSTNWHGGGSFVYCELAKCNQHYVDEAVATQTDDEMVALLERVIKSGFISSRLKPSDIADSATDFESLSIEDKKRFIIELLDKNMLYVNLCDIDDEEYAISEADKAFTRSFYGLEEK